ncbi:GAF nad PAS sensor-containing signal transduction histidine kinase [Candidatus Mancarchaeum acidiphilum]|uniref:histidine kinase n=1 Tax=Candidatus Mancarchaeum acidiphilum TaxID=1920749 RepID=A0A218NLW7_9ARCH|nr:ATP-binding protein [Candidatus Mancarchaeum acidiphilum]ASI13441.1 GAF nad PAS sensor-containing signal transduction histidine kinase [Candidatus Mancarchaeum acidiphilum]
MVEDIFINKFLADMINLTNTTDTEYGLKDYLSRMFGIENITVKMFDTERFNQSSLEAYISNTKKSYIDNEINEYSAFPELLNYRNNGYSSCLIAPIKVDNRVIGEVNLFSTHPNKFTPDISSLIELSVTLFGLNLYYSSEKKKVERITSYFDASFNSSVPQALVNSAGDILKFNKQFVNLIGSYPEDKKIASAIGVNFSDLYDLTDGKYIQKAIKNGKPVRINSYKIRDSLIHITLIDQSEHELLSSINSAINLQNQFLILILDDKLDIRNFAGSLYDKFNEIHDLLTGKNLNSFVGEANGKLIDESLKNQQSFKSTLQIEFPNKSINGRISIEKCSMGYAAMITNIEKELYAENLDNTLDDFINTTTDMIIKVNEFGYIEDCNDPTVKNLGYPDKSGLIGKEIKSIYYEGDLETFDTNFSFIRKGEPINSISSNMIKRDGDSIPVIYSIRRIDDKSSQKYILIIHSLETKRELQDMESKLHKSDIQAKHFKSASDLKSEFIYDITHELKTPLTNIKGFAKLMKDGEFGQINEDQASYLDTILEESDRLMLIISQVLDAAKLEADKVKLDVREVNLKELYSNPSIKSMEEAAKNKGLSFTWDIAYDVPNIDADLNRLIQVLVNLIGNSIKFTESGGITVKIFKKSRKSVQFEVNDTGIGISDEDKRKIFKKFYQAPKRGLVKPDGTGTGLGLAITKDIVSLHGGKIRFDSKLGKGTKFWFTLPITYKNKASNKA